MFKVTLIIIVPLIYLLQTKHPFKILLEISIQKSTFMPPFEEEGHIALHLNVTQSVHRLVIIPNNDRSISLEPFNRLLSH
jgi:hypothetical protein